MSPIMMALLGLLAAGSSRLTASAFECLVSDSPANPASPSGTVTAGNPGGGIGDILGGLLGGKPGSAPATNVPAGYQHRLAGVGHAGHSACH